MNRREFLECAAVLIGGVSASSLGYSLTADQMTYLATAPDYTSATPNYLSPEQRKIIAAVAERIIPKTDTPGAIDAGVPRFIELMVQDWFNDQERGIFDAGLKDLQHRIPEQYAKSFDQLSQAQQLAELEALESDASDADWYQPGKGRAGFLSNAPFICQMKELTIWGFFTSKVGVTEVLRYQPMPMKFDGHYPRTPDDSTWAPFAFYR